MIQAVIFDMDGLLFDSEVYWEQARAGYCRRHGCAWCPEDELTVKGHNSPEWAAKIRQHCGLHVELDKIIGGVSAAMRELYEQRLPILPGAVAAVRAVASSYPTAIASSSPPDLIEFAITETGVRSCFQTIVSADSVGRGKPAPDVFLATARELGVPPACIAVFEDSTAGITAGVDAGMKVIAVPNPHFPPAPAALAKATLVLDSLEEFDLAMVAALH